MGLLDKSSQNNQSKTTTPPDSINKRMELRYEITHVQAIDHTAKIDLGLITDISISGLRIKKTSVTNLTNPNFTFKFQDITLIADLIWQDEKFMGLRLTKQQINKDLIKKLTKKIDAKAAIKKSKTIYDAIKKYSRDNVMSSLINLMVELESSETDITKLKKYIEEISVIYTNINNKKQSAEKEEYSSLDDDSININEQEKEDLPKEEELIDLMTQIIDTANSAENTDGVWVKDIDFAIARIGLSAVKDISVRFVKRMITNSVTVLTDFQGFEAYNILKTVMFKKLTPFFSFHDDNGTGSSLLSIETVGVDFLATKTVAELSEFYINPQTIYSELSRHYERRLFGTDLLKVNKIFLETISPVFGQLYDGYIISHQILNTSLILEDDVKLSISRRKLNYAYLLFMSYLLCQFYIGRDNESGVNLMNRLSCTGMDKHEIDRFLKDTIGEANKIVGDFGLKTLIRDSASPNFSLDIKRFLPEDTRFGHFLEIMDGLKVHKRVVLRFEDDDYTHFVINKLINVHEFGINRMPYVVISCDNLSIDEEIATEAFNFFGLIIFKNIDKIPGSLAKGFIKLWREYEGIIITTYSNYSFIEFDRFDLYKFLRQYMVDFPSYFVNSNIHKRMIDHTAEYMKTIRAIDKEQYQMDYMEQTCSMGFIKTEELGLIAEEYLVE